MQLPSDFIALMRAQLGDASANALFAAITDEPSPVSIRLNPLKRVGQPEGERVPWCPDAFYLRERPAFTFDPLLHAGAYYVQEASSMFLYQAIKDLRPHAALDLCAAPGGKSTLLRSTLPADCLLISNEPMPKRAQVLAENMAKWGHANTLVTQHYPAEFAAFIGCFDLIVVDAPCSGEGMFRKDEQAVSEWSLRAVATCAERQRDIVETIWPCLAPGGTLVYSTCTYNAAEDDENVLYLRDTLDADLIAVPHDRAWGITEHEAGYHFYPHRTRGEGFYLAVLKKKGEEALRPCPTRLLHTLSQKVRDGQPDPALAISTTLTPDAYPRFALTYEQAIQYLRREALRIEAPRGYVVVTYRGLPLGFVKSIGTRANNLYPQEWRIRSTYTPNEVRVINH